MQQPQRRNDLYWLRNIVPWTIFLSLCCIGVVLLINSVLSIDSVNQTADVPDDFQLSEFHINREALTLEEHEEEAVAWGGHVTSITSSDELHQVQSLFKERDIIIGGLRKGSGNGNGPDHWEWTDGTPWQYENWAGGQPNNTRGRENRVQMRQNGQWNDVREDYRAPAVYKRKVYKQCTPQLLTLHNDQQQYWYARSVCNRIGGQLARATTTAAIANLSTNITARWASDSDENCVAVGSDGRQHDQTGNCSAKLSFICEVCELEGWRPERSSWPNWAVHPALIISGSCFFDGIYLPSSPGSHRYTNANFQLVRQTSEGSWQLQTVQATVSGRRMAGQPVTPVTLSLGHTVLRETCPPNTEQWRSGYSVVSLQPLLSEQCNVLSSRITTANIEQTAAMDAVREASQCAGLNLSRSIMVAANTNSTSTPTQLERGQCYDTDNGATDKDGDGCSEYTTSPSWCGGYDDDDFNSWAMCCVCSGLHVTPPPPPPPTPTSTGQTPPRWQCQNNVCLARCESDCSSSLVEDNNAHTDSDRSDGSCYDTDNGATDKDGDNCSRYTTNPSWCGGYDDDDFNSLAMCCACSGHHVEENQPISKLKENLTEVRVLAIVIVLVIGLCWMRKPGRNGPGQWPPVPFRDRSTGKPWSFRC